MCCLNKFIGADPGFLVRGVTKPYLYLKSFRKRCEILKKCLREEESYGRLPPLDPSLQSVHIQIYSNSWKRSTVKIVNNLILHIFVLFSTSMAMVSNEHITVVGSSEVQWPFWTVPVTFNHRDQFSSFIVEKKFFFFT